MQGKLVVRPGRQRRAAVIVQVAVTTVALVGFAALAVDIGMLSVGRAELQRSADAAALAGARELLDDARLSSYGSMDLLCQMARDSATELASLNPVLHDEMTLDAAQDIQVGYWSIGTVGPLDTGDAQAFNAVRTIAVRSEARGTSVGLTFAKALGFQRSSMAATATAAFSDKLSGFRVTSGGGNAQLLPFAVHEDAWNALTNGGAGSGDNYRYDKLYGEVLGGGDGINELNIYPGAAAGQLPPGNFGTVDIGPSNNSTADIARQILYGVSAEDLDTFGGELKFDENGVIHLNGDTGISAGVKDELEAIKGQPRILPIFRTVSGPGNNATYEVVGFAGVRIVNVKLTGAMKSKALIVQPAVVVDPTATSSGYSGISYNVYEPVQLVQ